MLDQSQAKAVDMSEQANRQPTTKRKWGQVTQEEQQLILLKAVEMVLRGKELTPALQQTLPTKIVQALTETVKEQDKYRTLGTRSIPQRLQMLVDRLRSRGLLDKPAKADNPLDRLDPAQRKRQLAAEALELRRQNAIQMTEATKLLPKRV